MLIARMVARRRERCIELLLRKIDGPPGGPSS
jgi:hypothetical protein